MSSYRVLIVDDQHEARRVIRAGLETLPVQMQIVDVPSGEEAILVNSSQPFDLLVVDVRLPGISGLELTKRAQFRNPNLSIILVTGVSDLSIRDQVAKAGADAFFFKPVEMVDFLEAVKRCLKLNSETIPPLVKKPAQPSAARITERLVRIRSVLEADCVLLINERGEIAAKVGSLPAELDANAFVQSVHLALSAIGKTASLVGTKRHGDLAVISGKLVDLVFTHLNPDVGLLVVLPEGSILSLKERDLGEAMRTAAADLVDFLSEIGVPVESQSEGITLPPSRPQEKVEEAPLNLDDLFDHGLEGVVSNADQFWETIVDDGEGDQPPSSDAISFTQARTLGLTPEDQ